MRPNFIGKFVQKNYTFITQLWFQNQSSSFNSWIFFHSHSSTVICYYVTSRLKRWVTVISNEGCDLELRSEEC